MIITSSDYRIKCEHKNFTLLLSTKKGEFKTAGYFSTLESAIKRVITFRKSKKYPGKEKPEELQSFLNKLKEINELLNSCVDEDMRY